MARRRERRNNIACPCCAFCDNREKKTLPRFGHPSVTNLFCALFMERRKNAVKFLSVSLMAGWMHGWPLGGGGPCAMTFVSPPTPALSSRFTATGADAHGRGGVARQSTHTLLQAVQGMILLKRWQTKFGSDQTRTDGRTDGRPKKRTRGERGGEWKGGREDEEGGRRGPTRRRKRRAQTSLRAQN
jgi:hypothetical protein